MSLNSQILNLLKEVGRPMTTDEIAKAMCKSDSTAFGACNALWMMGRVTRISMGPEGPIAWEASS